MGLSTDWTSPTFELNHSWQPKLRLSTDWSTTVDWSLMAVDRLLNMYSLFGVSTYPLLTAPSACRQRSPAPISFAAAAPMGLKKLYHLFLSSPHIVSSEIVLPSKHLQSIWTSHGISSSQNEVLMKEKVPVGRLYLNLVLCDTWVLKYRRWKDRVGHGMLYYLRHGSVSLPEEPAVVEQTPAGLAAVSYTHLTLPTKRIV